MKINNLILTFTAVLTIYTATSQSLIDARKLTESERFEDASNLYKALLAADTKGEAYFYYADNFIKWDELDSAKMFLNKGVAVNANFPLLYTALGKVAYFENNSTEATSNFNKALEVMKAQGNTYSKDQQALVYMKIAESYIQGSSKNPDEAIRLLREAEKLSPNNADVYLLLGDALLDKNVADASETIKNYEKALQVDKTSIKALLRQGQLYTRVLNFEEALKFYKLALEMDPNFAPAYRERAELYYKAGRVSQGIEDYKKYLELNNSPSARTRYAVFLYVAKEYQAAIDEASSAISSGATDPVLYRIIGYSQYETKNYVEGITNLEKFLKMANQNGKPKIIMKDYSYYGKLLAETGKDSLGIMQIEKALTLDPRYTEGYADIASIYFKQKNYGNASRYYREKLNKSDKPDYNDYNYLGRSLYLNKDFAGADSAFSKVVDLLPTNVIGYVWRGRSNNRLEVNAEAPSGMAKAYYEKVIELGSADVEKNKKDLVEAYSYLGFLYFVNKDYKCSKAAWTKVKELEPTNERAAKAFSDKDINGATGDCELIKKQQP